MGTRLRYDVTPSFYIQSMVVDGNPGSQSGNDKHGLRFDLSRSSGALIFGEAGYRVKPSDENHSLGGSYKLGGFYDTEFFQAYSSGAMQHGDYGLYAIVDHQLYRAPGSTQDCFQGLGAFGKISFAPDNRNPVFFYFDTGLNYTGLLPGRSKDIFGLAFSFEKMSDHLLQPSGSPVPTHYEDVLEITYQANLNDWFSVQPDLQVIFNPGGIYTTPTAVVAGIRCNISF